MFFVINNLTNKKNKEKKQDRTGFTLLELLIVIAILAILMTLVVLTLNPSETLKKARDTQRVTDLSTLNTAIGLYVSETASPSMGTTTVLYVSVATAGTDLSGCNPSGATFATYGQVATKAEIREIDATGWIPINFSTMSIGSPISNLPQDPTNTSSAVPANTDLLYRYGANASNQFEIDATFESTYYKTTIDLDGTDGGDQTGLYETGTLTTLIASCAEDTGSCAD